MITLPPLPCPNVAIPSRERAMNAAVDATAVLGGYRRKISCNFIQVYELTPKRNVISQDTRVLSEGKGGSLEERMASILYELSRACLSKAAFWRATCSETPFKAI